MDWTFIVALIMLFAMLSILVMLVILWLITGRYFESLLREKNIPYPFNFAYALPDGMGRAVRYAAYIVRRKPGERDAYRKLTGKFDFRTHARRIDHILAIIFMIQQIVLIVCFAILVTASMLS